MGVIKSRSFIVWGIYEELAICCSGSCHGYGSCGLWWGCSAACRCTVEHHDHSSTGDYARNASGNDAGDTASFPV